MTVQFQMRLLALIETIAKADCHFFQVLTPLLKRFATQRLRRVFFQTDHLDQRLKHICLDLLGACNG